MSESPMLKPQPRVTQLNRPFWDGCNNGRLVIQKCRACTRAVFYPRVCCPFCKAGDLDWIEASGNYLVLHAGKGNHVLRETLTSLEGQLSPKEFFQINRSALVQVDRVRHVEPAFNDQHIVVLADGTRLTLTRGLRELQERLRFA